MPCKTASRARTLPRRLLALPIVAYSRYLSPLLPRRCKYEPTCSAYALQALREHRFADAIRFYERAAALSESDFGSLSMASQSYQMAGDIEGARSAARRIDHPFGGPRTAAHAGAKTVITESINAINGPQHGPVEKHVAVKRVGRDAAYDSRGFLVVGLRAR